MKRAKTTRTKNALTVLVATVVCGFFAPVNAPAQTNEENLVSVSASVAPDKAPPGAEAVLNLKMNLATGAHANSNQTADPNLIPTVFLPKPQTGFIWGQPEYPKTTEVIEWYSTEPLSVFEIGAVIVVPLTIVKTAMPGQLAVEGSLRIQICDSEKCYPVRRIPISASLSVVKEGNTKPTDSALKSAQKTNSDNSIAKSIATAPKQPADASGLDFAFVDFSGKERKFREFRGKFVLLDFWATWCKPCLADIPKLKELYAKYKDQNFEIIGMNSETIGDEEGEPDLEFAKETAARAKQIVTTRGVTWTQSTSETAVPIAVKTFGVKSLPTKILLDKAGKIIATIGEKDDLTAMIEKLLKGAN
jgi:thiol-disulfide isomerase/thioredoxin